MGIKNEKEKTTKKNRIKIWIFGIITLILILVAVSLLIPKGEMTTSVNIDGATVYVPNEDAANYFIGNTIANLVIIPLIIIFLTLTIICFVKDVRLRETKKKLSR